MPTDNFTADHKQLFFFAQP